MMTKGPARDVRKEARWRKLIGEAARSGLSIRGFCRRRGLDESQFYAWRRELKGRDEAQRRGSGRQRLEGQGRPTFALVSTDDAGESAGIELVLEGGRRLRISRGVDAETLRAVVDALGEAAQC